MLGYNVYDCLYLVLLIIVLCVESLDESRVNIGDQ